MITVLGSINLDLIGTVSRIPAPGETVPGDHFSTAPGGKGANQALAAARAGASVRMVGAVGGDTFGHEAVSLLDPAGVDLSRIRIVAGGATGIAMIFVDLLGENVIAILPGANAAMGVADAETAMRGLHKTDILVLQQEIAQDATHHALDLAHAGGVMTILNTAPFLATTPELARKASIVVANESEFALLTGQPPEVEVMRAWARGNRQTIIVTLGSEGARAATPDADFSVPALPITPVDTVGAGDTFVGYLAAGLDAGLDLEAAMRRAAVAASLACLKPGAQPAIPMANDVNAR